MKQLTALSILLRILIPLIVIPLLGISPLPHGVNTALLRVRNALQVNAPLDAAAHLPKLLEFYPWRAELWELTGHYALLGGAHEIAATYFQQAATLKHLTPTGYAEMGDAAKLNGNLTTAVEAWEAAILKVGTSVELQSRLLEAHQLLGDLDAVVNDLQTLADLEPVNAGHFHQLGIILATKQPEAGLAYLIRAAELDPTLSHEVKTLTSAIESARIHDDPAYTLLVSGRTLASLGQWKPAGEAFQEATRIRPDYAEAWAYLGEAQQHTEASQESDVNSEAGFAALNQAMEINPQSISANTFLALYWQRQGRDGLALVYLHNADSIEPENPAILAEIGNTLASMGDLDKAHRYYSLATEHAPNDPLYWRLLADFSIRYKKDIRDTGLPAARRAVLLNFEDPVSLDVMAEVFILLNDPLSAKRFLIRALQANPDYAQAHLHLGFVYVLQGMSAEAWKHLTLAEALAEPSSLTAEQAQRMLDTYFQ